MPPKSPENAFTQTTVRGRRPVHGRVVPAIPYALSKPKVLKSLPKSDAAHQASTDPASTIEVTGQNGADARTAAENNAGLSHEGMVTPQSSQKHVGVGDGMTNGSTSTTAQQEHVAQISPAHIGAQTSQAARPPTPAPTDEEAMSNPTVISSPATVRKPTDRMEMRQIRTEFPPAFIPNGEQYTPQSTTSSRSRPQLPVRAPTHAHHPSMSSIIFGGGESSTSSPVPPQSTTFTSMPSASPTQPATAHVIPAPDATASRIQHPAYQSTAPWSMRPNHQHAMPPPPFHAPVQPPFRAPPRETFTPVTTPHLNEFTHRSRDGSQSSSIAALDGQRPVPDLQSPIGLPVAVEDGNVMSPGSRHALSSSRRYPSSHFAYHLPHVPPPHFPHPDLLASYENAEALRMHFLMHLDTPDLADCHLRISDQRTGAQQSLLGHKIVLARSPTLLQMIREQQGLKSLQVPMEIPIILNGPFLRISPLMDAIRFLYGGPPPALNHYQPGSTTGHPAHSHEDRMQFSLQQIAVGMWLQTPVIAQQAAETAANLLHWDTLPLLLAFALDGGLGQVWTSDDAGVERVSTCSSDDSLNKPELFGFPTYDPHATYLLHRIIDFIVHALPPNFYLDTSASQLAVCPRLPPDTLSGHQSRPSRSDPRLSKIRFGEISMHDHQRPSLASTNISSVLLSLPFPLLKPVLEHYDLTRRIGSETVSSIMRSVVHEREIRRQKTLKQHSSVGTDEGPNSHLMHNLYWVESIDPNAHHPTGCRLVRRRRGIDTPLSSGTES